MLRILGPNAAVQLVRAVRHERAIALEAAGQNARANRELQLLDATDPRYEDVAARLGLTPSV